MNPIYLTPLHQTDHDLNVCYEWRKDPSTRQHSFRTEFMTFTKFESEYHERYFKFKKLPPQKIMEGGNWVGVIYLEPHLIETEGIISIYLNPEKTSQQIGTRALREFQKVAEQIGVTKLIAEVLPDNLRAYHSFLKVGFQDKGVFSISKYGKMHKVHRLVYNRVKPRNTTIIAEIGSNCIWGSLADTEKLAKVMIEKAYIAGADAVKFQLFSPESLYVPNAGSAAYLGQNINTLIEKHVLAKELVEPLATYSNYLGIEWMCSAFSPQELNWINPFVKRHKIASYELRHIRLLEAAALAAKPILLSTGASNTEDIEWALDVLKKHKAVDVTLLHCSAKYPTEAKGLHLNCIPQLHQQFGVPVGLSDHSAHPLLAPVVAVSLGATVVEKHVTLHRDLIGPDHSFAIQFEEFKDMVEAIGETEAILGVAKKAIFEQEEELAAFARRGLQAIKPISKGDILKEGENIDILRPGLQRLGLHPKYLDEIHGKVAKRNLKPGQGLQHEDILW